MSQAETAKKTVSVLTYGCRANQYDSAALEHVLGKREYHRVDAGEDADYFIINTCAITEQAEIEARQTLRRLKRRNPQAKVVVTGCSAQVSAEKYTRDGLADLVIGNEFKANLVDELSRLESQAHDRSARFDSVFYEGGVRLSKHSRSFLKIQDGCSQFCSFCIVPFARGLNRSIPVERILDSLRELALQGIPEVVLTGIHLGTYGKDLSPRLSLLDLLKRIEEQDALPRVRLSSIDPEEVTPEMIDFLASSRVFCEHLHLPLQSGDAGILKRMRRRYSPELFFELTHELSRRIPNLCIGTDVIVGFPGEDDAAFENTVRLIRETPVSYLHVFPYSPREGTKAATFEETVSLSEKKRRVKALRDLSERKRSSFEVAQASRVHEAVIENRKTGVYGLTRNYVSVRLDYAPSGAGRAQIYVEGMEGLEAKGRPVLDAGIDLRPYEV